ncbi:MAG TPA: glycosyltransferase family 1 protein [Acidobacteriota bacterium]|jgi:glycosyltransferase involved in cell wall biosynthesis
MKIAIDISSAAKPYPTGIGRYSVELVRTIVQLFRPNDGMRLLIRPSRWKHRGWISPLAKLDGIESPRLHTGALPALFVRRDEVFHCTGTSLPAALAALKLVTVHDMLVLEGPGLAAAPWIKKRGEKTQKVIARADMILAVSGFTRERILCHFPELSPERVRVTHNGFDHGQFSPERKPGDQDTLSRYAIMDRPYILFVGRIGRRKNPDGLIRAFARTKAARDHLLVFAGPHFDSDTDSIARDAQTHARVRFLDWVPDNDLPALYRGAAAFALPSHYEGFGIPLVEAMACGTPSLASNVTALPEVAGDAALLANPEDVDDIAAKLDRLLTDQTLRRDLRVRGPLQAKKFTWRACAETTLAAYRDLLVMGRR